MIGDTNEVRALLDVSHQRERLLYAALVHASRLLEGAAIAQDRAFEQESVMTEVAQVLSLMRKRPVPDRGLLLHTATTECRRAGSDVARQYLLTQLSAAREEEMRSRIALDAARDNLAAIIAERDALVAFIADPELSDRFVARARETLSSEPTP